MGGHDRRGHLGGAGLIGLAGAARMGGMITPGAPITGSTTSKSRDNVAAELTPPTTVPSSSPDSASATPNPILPSNCSSTVARRRVGPRSRAGAAGRVGRDGVVLDEDEIVLLLLNEVQPQQGI